MNEQRNYVAGHTQKEWRDAVQDLMNTAKAQEYEGLDAPGHGHRVQGKWDATGQPCDWCTAWNKLRAMLAAAPTAQAEKPAPTDAATDCKKAIRRVYAALNSPIVAGRKYAQYDRKVIEAALDVLVQVHDQADASAPASPKQEGGAV